MTWLVLSIAAVLAASPPIPYEAEIDAALAETAAIYPVPKALVVAVISVESGFRPRAVSPAGAKGLMQLMPYTARRVGVDDQHLFDPAQNLFGGTRLLAVLLRHYEGDVISALVAYNARPRGLFSPIPRNGMTPEYVWRVLARARQVSMRAADCLGARDTALISSGLGADAPKTSSLEARQPARGDGGGARSPTRRMDVSGLLPRPARGR